MIPGRGTKIFRCPAEQPKQKRMIEIVQVRKDEESARQ